ncbi:DNA/RNA non-specific endonuclease [Vagococcus silagei]|uniref:DNA-entry nuclease n=1 Tax=Vagococcus silagei TaxID=2508885 RepID=A0A4S3B7Q4_9ENTE|nr:DNA/RNA non-specific endonuclease [Vagococcus silagei]THB61726.1 DNA-entry nuclease [Vagococcus silagei]
MFYILATILSLSLFFGFKKNKSTKFLPTTIMLIWISVLVTGCSSTNLISETVGRGDPENTESRKIDSSINLADLEYEGQQTIEINDNKPNFSKGELSMKNDAWEKYGELDHLNRVTSAEAMLNQSLMPTQKRGDISAVKPTGWKNKKIKNGYLFNRSHLIGHALAGEDDNWQNLMTGTRQLNSPEMVRFEMDVKHYLDQSKDHYVRYSVTPIFRGDELLARGVQMRAQSINSNAISFNIYIFNIQDGVTLDYQDGSSTLTETTQHYQEKIEVSETEEKSTETNLNKEETFLDEHGNGLIKGSNNKIYHLPDTEFYDKVTNPKEMFKTVSDAEQAGYRAPKK